MSVCLVPSAIFCNFKNEGSLEATRLRQILFHILVCSSCKDPVGAADCKMSNGSKEACVKDVERERL